MPQRVQRESWGVEPAEACFSLASATRLSAVVLMLLEGKIASTSLVGDFLGAILAMSEVSTQEDDMRQGSS